MPTVLRVLGCRVFIYPNDHGPAHVHVEGGGKEAKFYLRCPDGPPELQENHGFSRAMLNNVLTELKKNIGLLCEKWRQIHGDL